MENEAAARRMTSERSWTRASSGLALGVGAGLMPGYVLISRIGDAGILLGMAVGAAIGFAIGALLDRTAWRN